MSQPERICPVCTKPLIMGEGLYFDNGTLIHQKCISTTQPAPVPEGRSEFSNNEVMKLILRSTELESRIATLTTECEGLRGEVERLRKQIVDNTEAAILTDLKKANERLRKSLVGLLNDVECYCGDCPGGICAVHEAQQALAETA